MFKYIYLLNIRIIFLILLLLQYKNCQCTDGILNNNNTLNEDDLKHEDINQFFEDGYNGDNDIAEFIFNKIGPDNNASNNIFPMIKKYGNIKKQLVNNKEIGSNIKKITEKMNPKDKAEAMEEIITNFDMYKVILEHAHTPEEILNLYRFLKEFNNTYKDINNEIYTNNNTLKKVLNECPLEVNKFMADSFDKIMHFWNEKLTEDQRNTLKEIYNNMRKNTQRLGVLQLITDFMSDFERFKKGITDNEIAKELQNTVSSFKNKIDTNELKKMTLSNDYLTKIKNNFMETKNMIGGTDKLFNGLRDKLTFKCCCPDR